MEWTDDAIVLSLRRHGETSAVVSLLTAERGRHGGLARGAYSRRMRGVLMPGNGVTATWRARTEDHLGSLKVEPGPSRAGFIMDDPGRLAALNSAVAILDGGLMEREAHPALFRATGALFDALAAATDDWAEAYFAWELGLLGELGFGLDLSKCAGDGRTEGLGYVSPKSARAVSLAAGAPYREKLLPLPRFLIGERGRPPANHPQTDLADAAELTGHFLERHVFSQRNTALPAARGRFVEILLRDNTTSGVLSA
ncbi:MAG: DNA repair protein RecO [Minwuia sp.]|uniref:DNA repair protein RecO n=1 Tax=Minwuia sp. TaxID=2493630 RepID=UPI003A84DE9B